MWGEYHTSKRGSVTHLTVRNAACEARSYPNLEMLGQLLDHLFGDGEQSWRNVQTERLWQDPRSRMCVRGSKFAAVPPKK
jgi:hypothetical protein